MGVYVAEMEVFEYMLTPTGVKYSAPAGMHDDAVISLALAKKHFNKYGCFAEYHLL